MRIEAPRGWSPIDLRELWRHRDLLFFLVLREFRSTTRGTKLGALWIILQPLAIAAVLTVVLGTFVRIPTGDVPYVVIILTGFLPWSYFSNAVSRASLSMIANSHLLTKVYFPRLIIPTVPVISGLVDLAIFLFLLTAVALALDIEPRQSWALLPLVAAFTVALAIGAGLWLSALTLRMRDIGHAVPVVLQIGMYLSPVLYPVALVPERWRWLYDLNPMVGIIEFARWCVLNDGPFPTNILLIATAEIAGLAATGVYFFRMVEDNAADIV